ncbi:MAG: carbohydrate ABC transporter permease, partial [Faecousia sp.]
MEEKSNGFSQIGGAISGFFGGIGQFFSKFGTAFAKGDLFVKLSLIWWGAGYFRRKQYVKALLLTLLEAGVILFTFNFAMSYVPKFGSLGTVQAEQVFNIQTMQSEWNDYDNSFMILLFSLFSFVVWAAAVAVCLRNVINVYALQVQSEQGRHINTFVEDLRDYLDKKFHITLLTLPTLGIVIFTLIPMLLLILVAFTNYDQQHMPPTNLFTWVGFNNFVSLFGGSITSTFGYAFVRVLGWTIVWSFFATLTTYFGGILMSLLLNSKLTRCTRLWRTMLVVTIAVPQFVSLLLMRNFFANTGIMNTICANIGLTGFLREIGLISTSYIPFLSAPIWAHVMIILINIWVGIPYQMLIATGVLMNLPTDQVESARMDGANPFQVFKSITMPYMLQVTGPALVTD